MRFKFILSILIVSLVFFSCKTSKSPQQYSQDSKFISIESKDTFVLVNNTSYNNISLKTNGIFNYENKEINFNANIIIIHDSLVWMSASVLPGIEIFRILVNKDSIKIINRFSREYYTDSFEKIYEKIGICINFDVVEALLVANDFISFNHEIIQKHTDSLFTNYTISRNIIIGPDDKNCNLLQNLKISNNSLKIVQNELNYWNRDNISISIKYEKYDLIGTMLLPTNINIELKSYENPLIIAKVLFKQIKLNQNVSTPFNVPNWGK
ncbi:MAG: DUF4292 domain-containing protein [Bacteroidales bacterium]|nr:DUF4292 domain-containing protein [Bacteroidales bacterium]MDI9576040.1 DUF4292 domain-containing protein [Bacteroidota bacterium]MDD3754920.1 DUF4292 domain-containing protein [Bacteroidales bacterium]HHW58797.1 DUF4292 domain-containing protein [Bacteroidales bacterium]HOB77074.1 DUF4292 domain-containing protein [Bacteroidales bacterium]